MIGMDLGSKFFKICKIIKEDTKKKTFSVVSAMQDISALDDIGKRHAIISLLQRLDCEKDDVFLAVGGTDIINRDIVLNHVKGSLKDKVMSEIQGTLNEELNKMYSSFSILKTTENSDIKVLASMVPIKKVDTKFALINSIGSLFVKGVTLENFALANSFIKFGPNYKNTESIVLLNIGHKVTNLVVLNSQDLVFTKDIDFGGLDITKEISSLYQIPEKLSEEIKRRDDLKQTIDFNMTNVLKKNISSLIEVIFRTIEHCVTRQLIVSVDRIVITGGCVLLEGIDSFIEDTLGIPVERWNPLENNKFEGYINKFQGYFLPIALGLALEKEIKK